MKQVQTSPRHAAEHQNRTETVAHFVCEKVKVARLVNLGFITIYGTLGLSSEIHKRLTA